MSFQNTIATRVHEYKLETYASYPLLIEISSDYGEHTDLGNSDVKTSNSIHFVDLKLLIGLFR